MPATAWRTGKNMDLLRLLALSNGHTLRSGSLIEKLWPNAAPDRGRHSLRTAASQIRQALHAPCVERLPDGLVLRGAWVDAEAFVSDARAAQVAHRSARHTDALRITGAADELYRGVFRAHNDGSPWAVAERSHLERIRHEMYTSAATSALELGNFREAREFANAAVQIDRGAETAYRTLMQAYAELGEVASALRVFETYRAHLAEELGADPSPQTRELHLKLLRG
ncbi:MAG: AfsR/SARP family transcriptional regulator [Nocardioides sp.]